MKKLTAATLAALSALLACACAAGPGQNVKTGQHPQTAKIAFKDATGSDRSVVIRYLLYLPESYGRDPDRRWPLILFLHGMGERGDDISLLTRQPLPGTLVEKKDFPFVVVSPQLPLEQQDWQALIEPLDLLIARIQKTCAIDPARLYLTGLSMGGFGTWSYGLKHPGRFAALVPIAGGWFYRSRAVPRDIGKLASVPIWAFHGAQDETVPSWQSEVLVKALESRDGKVRFTLYPDADHEAAWRRAYADPELWSWLLGQSLSR